MSRRQVGRLGGWSSVRTARPALRRPPASVRPRAADRPAGRRRPTRLPGGEARSRLRRRALGGSDTGALAGDVGGGGDQRPVPRGAGLEETVDMLRRMSRGRASSRESVPGPGSRHTPAAERQPACRSGARGFVRFSAGGGQDAPRPDMSGMEGSYPTPACAGPAESASLRMFPHPSRRVQKQESDQPGSTATARPRRPMLCRLPKPCAGLAQQEGDTSGSPEGMAF